MIEYNKDAILKQVVSNVRDNLHKVQESVKSTKQRANDAPGAMVSHSDTSKSQLDNLAAGLNVRAYGLEVELRDLEGFSAHDNSNVAMGALVKIEDSDGENLRHCYVLPAGAGTTVEKGKGLVNIITTSAPLFNAMKGLEADDEFYFKKGKEKKEYCILDIL